MRALKIFSEVVIVLSGALLILVFSVGFFVARNPKETWGFLERNVLPDDLRVHWQDLKFDPLRQKARLWNPEISFTNLCVRKEEPRFSICFDRLLLETTVSFERILNPRLVIRKIEANSNYANYFRTSGVRRYGPQRSFFEWGKVWQNRMQTYSRFVEVEEVHFDILEFAIGSLNSQPFIIRASLHAQDLKSRAHLQLTFLKDGRFRIITAGELRIENWLSGRGPFADWKGSFEFARWSFQLDNVKMQWRTPHEVQATLSSLWNFRQYEIRSQSTLVLNQEMLAGDLTAAFHGLKKPFNLLKTTRLIAEMPQRSGFTWGTEASKIRGSIWLPVFFVNAQARPKLEKSCRCELPEQLNLDFVSNVNLRKFFSRQEGPWADLNLNLESLTNSLFETQTSAFVEFIRTDAGLKMLPRLDGRLLARSFQGLVTLFSAENILIPAPLSGLEGTLLLEVKGPVERDVDNWKFPFQITTDLRSERQRMDLQSQGSLQLNVRKRRVLAQTDLILRDVSLQLPPLDPVFGFPKILPDARFQIREPTAVAKRKKRTAFQFSVQARIRTLQPGSLKLLYPLAEPAIPLGLDLTYQSGKPVTGDISVSPFKVTYLRKVSTVERIKLSLNEPNGVFPVNARFRVDQSPYRVFIDILGNLRSPNILFSSDPYLDRSDIISVLLYGRPNNELVGLDSRTVGSFDAAMADRAIGIIGLWAFASTPIQSFSYNQLSRQYSAQLKLDGDTTLAVGTNWEEATSFEIQRRLSPRWVVSASVEPTEQDQQSSRIRLQWENRF